MEVEDSGIYECEVSNIDEVRKHGELVVYSEYINKLKLKEPMLAAIYEQSL